MKTKDFIAGRYETSNITTTDGETIKSVAGVIPSNKINWYYTYAQQRDYATNKRLSVGSTMLQGAAYDQMMKFVNKVNYDVESGENVGHDFKEAYQTGGRNYTGTPAYNDFSQNIFDLEGNVRTWTIEADDTYYRVYRGGSIGGYNWSASFRMDDCPPNNCYYYMGSVSQLYVK